MNSVLLSQPAKQLRAKVDCQPENFLHLYAIPLLKIETPHKKERVKERHCVWVSIILNLLVRFYPSAAKQVQ